VTVLLYGSSVCKYLVRALPVALALVDALILIAAADRAA
jgi:hypothetical protein